MNWNDREKEHWKAMHEAGLQPPIEAGNWVMIKNPNFHRTAGAEEYFVGLVFRKIADNWNIQCGDFVYQVRQQYRDRMILLPTLKRPLPFEEENKDGN